MFGLHLSMGPEFQNMAEHCNPYEGRLTWRSPLSKILQPLFSILHFFFPSSNFFTDNWLALLAVIYIEKRSF